MEIPANSSDMDWFQKFGKALRWQSIILFISAGIGLIGVIFQFSMNGVMQSFISDSYTADPSEIFAIMQEIFSTIAIVGIIVLIYSIGSFIVYIYYFLQLRAGSNRIMNIAYKNAYKYEKWSLVLSIGGTLVMAISLFVFLFSLNLNVIDFYEDIESTQNFILSFILPIFLIIMVGGIILLISSVLSIVSKWKLAEWAQDLQYSNRNSADLQGNLNEFKSGMDYVKYGVLIQILFSTIGVVCTAIGYLKASNEIRNLCMQNQLINFNSSTGSSNTFSGFTPTTPIYSQHMNMAPKTASFYGAVPSSQSVSNYPTSPGPSPQDTILPQMISDLSEIKFCLSCGSKLSPPGARFCNICGNKNY